MSRKPVDEIVAIAVTDAERVALLRLLDREELPELRNVREMLRRPLTVADWVALQGLASDWHAA